MTVSFRTLLNPGVALATAGAVALAPAVLAPSTVAAHPSVQLPAVHIQDIQLAGIGRDVYNAVQPYVQFAVDSADYWISFVPVIGPPIGDQISINYNALIQPLIANTVYYLSDVFADPLGFFGWTNSYLINQAYVGLGYLNAQASFFGLPPLPPFPFPPAPPLASVKAPRSAATARAAAAVEAPTEVATADPAPVTPTAGAVRTARKAVRAAASQVVEAAGQAGAETGAAVTAATSEVRGVAAARGEGRKAVAQARAAAKADTGSAG